MDAGNSIKRRIRASVHDYLRRKTEKDAGKRKGCEQIFEALKHWSDVFEA